MEEDKRKGGVGYLVVVLSLLSVVAVALIVVNIILATRSRFDRTAFEECLQIDDEYEATTCLDELAFSYYMEDDCEAALKVYDEVSENRFEKYTLMKVYDEARSMSLSCSESSQEYWNNKFEGIASQLEGRE